MKPTRLALPLLSLALCAGAANAQPQGYGPPPPPQGYGQGGYGQGGGWDAPPAEFRAAMQRGFHDGIEGARRDFENHVGVRHIYGNGPGYGPR